MGKSSKQTVGYRYFMGLHFAMCYGPVDALRRIFVGDREAWCGNQTESGEITIDAPDLFGGDEREGGVAGVADVMMGEATQTAPAYLTQQLGGLVPGYRGLFSLLFRGPSAGAGNGFVASNNAYVKPWAFQVQRITSGWACGETWYPEKAAIEIAVEEEDEPGSGFAPWLPGQSDPRNPLNSHEYRAKTGFSSFTAWGTFEDAIAAASTAVGYTLYPDQVTCWRQVPSGAYSIECGPWDGIDDEDADVLALCFNGAEISEVSIAFGNVPDSYNAFSAPFNHGVEADEFYWWGGRPVNGAFARGGLGWIASDGGEGVPGPTPPWIGLNNCIPDFGCPYESSGESGPFWSSFFRSDGVIEVRRTGTVSDGCTRDFSAMNPAHIVYQCVTDPQWGLGYPTAMIDEASFAAAADTLFDEGLGLCLQWTQQETVDQFVQRVVDHAGAVFAVDPATGKFTLTLIRDDYEPAELDVFDESNILRLESWQRVGYGETVNEITVVYRDVVTNKDASVTVQDLANIQAQGAVVSQTRQYPGLPTAELALRIAQRDLNAASTPLAKGRIAVNRDAWNKKPGDVIKLSWPKLGLSGVICRVLAIKKGTLTNGEIIIDIAEDVFGLPDSSYVAQEPGGWVEPDTSPQAITLQDVFEVPYWAYARTLTDSQLEQVDADAGLVGTVAAKPAPLAQSYRIYTRVGSAPYDAVSDPAPFTPTMLVAADVAIDDTEIVYEDAIGLDLIEPGDLAQIGSGATAELVKIVSVDEGSPPGLTVARGMLDTTPRAHASGTRIWVVETAGVDEVERATGESVNVKLATIATGGELALGSATPMSITLDQRFYRPYPPGNVLINGEAYPESIDEALTITWSHRDRIQQTAYLVEQDEEDIGPEPGTTYNCYLYNDDTNELLFADEGQLETVSTWEPGVSFSGAVRLEIESVRDGVTSWQKQVRRFAYDAIVVGTDVRLLENGDYRLLEDGGFRLFDAYGPSTPTPPEMEFQQLLQIAIDKFFVLSGKLYGTDYQFGGRAIRQYDAATYAYEGGVNIGPGSDFVTGFVEISGVMFASTIIPGTQTSTDYNSIYRVTQALETLRVPVTATSLAVLGGALWATNGDPAQPVVRKLNADTLAVEYEIDLTPILPLKGPQGLSSDGTDLYVVARGNVSALAKITPAGAVLWSKTIQRYASDCLYAEGKVWVLGIDELEVYDASTGDKLESFDTTYYGGAAGIPFPPYGKYSSEQLRYDGDHVIVRAKSGGVWGYRKYDPDTLTVADEEYLGHYWTGVNGDDLLLTGPPALYWNSMGGYSTAVFSPSE